MTRRSPAQVYRDLTAAGFSPQAATTMTAIAGAESGYNDTALGDVGLQDNVWGPSYGLYQVRTVKAQTGTGSDRDIQKLSSSDAAQAAAAYDISHQGTDFTPWTTYTSGAYRQFLSGSQAAASSSPVDATLTGVSSALGGGVASLLGLPSKTDWVNLLLTGGALLLALVLVGVGVAVVAKPAIVATARAGKKVAGTAAKVAAVAA